MTPPRSRDACTMTGPAALGRMWRAATRQPRMPSRRAVSTNVRSRNAAASPRMRRAYHGHHAKTMAMAACSSDGTQRRPDGERQQDRGKGQEDVHDAHQQVVEPAPGGAADEAHGHADGEGRDQDEHGGAHRDPGAEEDARPDVPAGHVGAQEVLAAGWLEGAHEVRGRAGVLREGRDDRAPPGPAPRARGRCPRPPSAPDVARRSARFRSRPSRRASAGPHRSLGSSTGRRRSTTRLAARYARAMMTVAPAMAGASSVVIDSATYEPRPGQS